MCALPSSLIHIVCFILLELSSQDQCTNSHSFPYGIRNSLSGHHLRNFLCCWLWGLSLSFCSEPEWYRFIHHDYAWIQIHFAIALPACRSFSKFSLGSQTWVHNLRAKYLPSFALDIHFHLCITYPSHSLITNQIKQYNLLIITIIQHSLLK